MSESDCYDKLQLCGKEIEKLRNELNDVADARDIALNEQKRTEEENKKLTERLTKYSDQVSAQQIRLNRMKILMQQAYGIVETAAKNSARDLGPLFDITENLLQTITQETQIQSQQPTDA